MNPQRKKSKNVYSKSTRSVRETNATASEVCGTTSKAGFSEDMQSTSTSMPNLEASQSEHAILKQSSENRRK